MQYKWTVLTVTTVGVLMAGLDSRIVIVGLPAVASALRADAEGAIWFTQSYLLTNTVVLLLIGRVTDIVGRVKVYTIGFAVFTLGSALTSFSVNPTQVIAFRSIQGIGAAALLANSATLITDATPPKELGFTLGINQVAFRVGAMAGLTVSGLILFFLDWRALFYVNVPIGIFGTLWARRRLREVVKPEKTPLDWMGATAFSACLTSFLLALTFDAYGIGEQTVVFELLAVGLVSAAFFAWHERRVEHPLVDLKILKIREFTGGILAQSIFAVSWGAVTLLLSLYFQLVLELSPFESGIRIIPLDIAYLITGPVSGKLSDRFGHLPFTTTGLVVMTTSLLLFSTVDPTTPFLSLLPYLVLLGAGMGTFTAPNMSSIMGAVPQQRRGVASALRGTFFNVGLTVSLNLAILIMTFTVPYTVVSSTLSSSNYVPLESDRLLFNEGLRQTFRWLAALSAVAILPSVLRGKRQTAAAQKQ